MDWTALTIRFATAQRDLWLKSHRPGAAGTYWDLLQQKKHDTVSIYGAEGFGRIEWWTDGILVAHMDVSYLKYDGVWSEADPRRFEDVWNAVVPDDLDDRIDSGWVFPQVLFAAENITGIHLSQEVLASSEFTLATVRAILPQAAGEYTRRLRDAGWDARALHP